jgi:hypothetical protein
LIDDADALKRSGGLLALARSIVHARRVGDLNTSPTAQCRTRVGLQRESVQVYRRLPSGNAMDAIRSIGGDEPALAQ